MARFRRSTWIDAPLETVWESHSHISGLLAVTPSWLDLRVEELRDDSGEPVETDAELLTGYEIDLSLKPLGVGPRQHWTSRIVTRERISREESADTAGMDTAMFRDRMVRGPMAHWEHTHRFEAVDGGTRMIDDIEYRLPPGRLGAAVSDVAKLGLAPAFWYRHRTSRRQYESGSATEGMDS
jgi:ligand-binding SRPBCC domain-containing protein